jgi:CspA family cold shock protein
MKGTVIWFDPAKGYGFLKSSTTGDEYFAHHSVIEMTGYRTLVKDQAVEFDVEAGGPKNRLQAVNVRLIK